jgi:hypothetical protein
MHWLTWVGIAVVALGTGLTILGQGLDSKKSTDLLSSQNELLLGQNKQQLSQNDQLLSQNGQLQKDNVQLQSDITKIKQINEELEKRIRPLSGVLTPDNKPTPKTPNGVLIPTDAIALFFGNSFAYTNSFPHTIIEVGTEPLIVINKQGNIITLTAKLFSEDGKVVAELKENQFNINPNNYFRLERPNAHTLVIYDQKGNESLNVNFINPKVIKLTGRFYLPNHPPIVITEEYQIFGNNMKMSNSSFGQNRVDIHLE